MSDIHQDLENRSFSVPSGIVSATVCSQSGKLPVPGLCDGCLKTEYFAEGTVPTDTCHVHYSGTVCAHDLLPASPECPFKTVGVLTLNPDTLMTIEPVENADGTTTATIDTDGDGVPDATTAPAMCQHNAAFFADPNHEAILQQQRLEMLGAGVAIPNADGSVTNPDGTITHPDGSITYPDGTPVAPGQ